MKGAGAKLQKGQFLQIKGKKGTFAPLSLLNPMLKKAAWAIAPAVPSALPLACCHESVPLALNVLGKKGFRIFCVR